MIKKILNTIVADGGDMTLSKKELVIATVPAMKFDLIRSSTELLPSLLETRQVYNVSYTAAANTNYKFVVSQIIDENQVSKTVEYESDATGADADIAAALVASFNGAKNGVKAVASGAATPITFTADAKYNTDNEIVGEPMISITNVSNMTIAAAQTNHTAALQGGSISNTTPRVVTAAAHGVVTGNRVTLAAITGATDLNATWRVTYLGATTYSLDGSVAGSAATVTSATAIEVAQASRGYIGDLIADGMDSGDITANTAYSMISFEYADSAVALMKAKRDVGTLKSRLYVSAHLTTSPYTVTTNYADFATRIAERLKGVLAKNIVLFVGFDNFIGASGGTWTQTRGAQGDYYLRRTAASSDDYFGIDITPALRTVAGKGYKLNSFDAIYEITDTDLENHVPTLDRIEYADATAVSVNSIAITGTLEVAVGGQPAVTNVAIDSPIYNVTDDSKYVIEFRVNTSGGAEVYDFYGVMLKFTSTEVDSEVVGNL